MEALAGSDQHEKALSLRLAIEQDYLEMARHNIEQYRKSGAVITFVDEDGNPLRNLNVEVDQVTQDFLFGNKIGNLVRPGEKDYKTDLQKKRFKDLFNKAVFLFIWGSYESIPGHPQWQQYTEMLNWALDNGITCMGHPLGWTGPWGTPNWLLELPEETINELYKARIFNNIIGFRDEIDMWIVVNEPVNTVPWEVAIRDKDNDNSFRYNVTGYEPCQFIPWVEKSYKWAHEADPDGDYIINEYFTLAIPEIRDRFYDHLKELQRRNTPFTGIGIQAHEPRQHWFSPIEIYKTFDLYSEFGRPIHITEFIPQSSGKEITGWREGIWTEEAQAEFAEHFYTLAFGHPSVASITWWGISDRNIWLEGGGLLDEEYNPKPVYNRLMKLIKEDWMTRDLALETDMDGQVSFRGFFGKYNVKVTYPDGSVQTHELHLKENGTNLWRFEL
jgi:endo-1,4-beta-xylanase